MSLLRIFGKALFWLTWPVLYVYFPRHVRARVLVLCGAEVLGVRSLYGSGRWATPGGGIKKTEDPQDAAIRETYEETGLSLQKKSLVKLYEMDVRQNGIKTPTILYRADITVKPPVNRLMKEPVETQWLKISDLTDKNSSPDLLFALESAGMLTRS